MAISINDLDDDYELENVLEPFEPQLTPSSEDDFLSDYLKSKGIDDTSKIKFVDDSGNIEERPWDSLTKEEKINILNTPLPQKEDNTNNLTNEEVELLNLIRLSNLTPSEYINQFSKEPVILEPTYKIDDLSDDELFLLDLESRVGEISDELAAEALNNAKLNEELFKKQVDGIRKEYKEREDYLSQQEQMEIEQLLQEAYNKFLDIIIDQISNFNSVGNLDLNFDDSDRDELAQFMLSRDEAGNNYLWQALLDPETLVKAAWFILNGEEALNNISEYFINLIKLVSENLYKKGFDEGKNGKTPSRPQVVINTQKTNPQQKIIKTIDDLDED